MTVPADTLRPRPPQKARVLILGHYPRPDRPDFVALDVFGSRELVTVHFTQTLWSPVTDFALQRELKRHAYLTLPKSWQRWLNSEEARLVGMFNIEPRRVEDELATIWDLAVVREVVRQWKEEQQCLRKQAFCGTGSPVAPSCNL